MFCLNLFMLLVFVPQHARMQDLAEALGDDDDDYLLIDCPGQIELYTHMPLMKQIADFLERMGFRLVVVYLLDSQFMCMSCQHT